MKKRFIIELTTGLFILLFVYTALSKIYNYNSFATVLSTSPLIGKQSGFFAWFIPVVELLTTILLFVPKWKPLGLYASFILMSVFTLYISYMLLFTPHLPCSCGGVISTMTWTQHLIFNIAFTLLALTGIVFARKDRRVPSRDVTAH